MDIPSFFQIWRNLTSIHWAFNDPRISHGNHGQKPWNLPCVACGLRSYAGEFWSRRKFGKWLHPKMPPWDRFN
jgi:hypothetical protein